MIAVQAVIRQRGSFQLDTTALQHEDVYLGGKERKKNPFYLAEVGNVA